MNHGIDLSQIPEAIRPSVLYLIAAHDAKEIENRLLRETLRLALIKKYGPKSEALSDNQLQLLELEPIVLPAEIDAEALRGPDGIVAEKPAAAIKSPPSHGRSPLPAHLPRTIVEVRFPAKDCICPKCSGVRKLIGYEESEQLHVVPAQYSVRVLRREKRACRNCSELGVQTAPAPERILPKGKLSDGFLIEALLAKFSEHMPVYRQCARILRDTGVEVSRQTLTDGLMVCGDLMQAISRAMAKELVSGPYIQADETPVPVQSAAVRGRNHRGFLWQYGIPGGSVVFDFQMGRSREGPKTFLKGFEGWLQCDGYSAYDNLGPKIRFAGCMAHARRRFFEAGQLAPLAPEPKSVLDLFARIYGVEQEARDGKLTPEARRELRQTKSLPLMQLLKARVIEIKTAALPASKLGKACTYTLNQWVRLEQFLADGILEADNNRCENGMRAIAIGRKNWLHLGDESTGPKFAAIASIIETCKRYKINVREYLNDVMPRLGSWPNDRVAELTPLAWKTAREQTPNG